MKSAGVRRRIIVRGLFVALVVLLATGAYIVMRSRATLPAADSATYEEITRAFYHGLASLQVGLLDDAKREFGRSTELGPGEPAGWANLGLAHLRLGEYDAASAAIGRAVALATQNSDVALLQGQLELARGRLDDAIARFRHAVDLDSRGLKPLYALAQALEAAGNRNSDDEAQRVYNQLLVLQPDNLVVLLDKARLAARRSDAAVLQDAVAKLGGSAGSWPAAASEQYETLQRTGTSPAFPDAARAVTIIRNVLLRDPAFRSDLAAVKTPTELIAEPFDRFLRLPAPSPMPSPPDTTLTFVAEPGSNTPKHRQPR